MPKILVVDDNPNPEYHGQIYRACQDCGCDMDVARGNLSTGELFEVSQDVALQSIRRGHGTIMVVLQDMHLTRESLQYGHGQEWGRTDAVAYLACYRAHGYDVPVVLLTTTPSSDFLALRQWAVEHGFAAVVSKKGETFVHDLRAALQQLLPPSFSHQPKSHPPHASIHKPPHS